MTTDKPQAGSAEGAEDFAAMLEQSLGKAGKLVPGQVVTAQVVSISADWIFLDLGGKGEGVLDRKELQDADGVLGVKTGDQVRAYFVSSRNNEQLFTTKVGAGPGGRNMLEDAWRSGIPVDGTVMKEVKGGFEVKIAGSCRAFCPYSRMGLGRDEQASSVIGRALPFRISEFGEDGRNIVLSRREIIEAERRKKKDELQGRLQEGMKVRGTVTSLRNFGAFVDIGGVDGLIPMSEIAWSRTEKASDLLSPGQAVEVIIKKLDWEQDRISLSLKDALPDPWDAVAEKFPVGSYHSGVVARLMQFGAFVTLAEGVDGLIHISKLGGGKRISHPKEVVKEGQSVEVKIEGVDRRNRKISLSLAEVSRQEEEAAATLHDYRQRESTETRSMGTLGDLLKAKLDKQGKN